MSEKTSPVYFTDFRTVADVSQGVKLQKLCRRAGIDISGRTMSKRSPT